MRQEAEAFDLRAALRDELAAAETALSDMPGAAGVHRCRVAIKRARTLARIGCVAAPGLADVFNSAARALMADLAAARDAAALAECARIEARKAPTHAAQALMRASAALTAQADAISPPDVDAARRALRGLAALAQVWPDANPSQVKRGVNRLIRRARKARKRADGTQKPARRHRWRKREKDRQYASELAGPAWPEEIKRRRGRAAKLTHALGGERDLLLLMERLASAPDLAGGAKETAAALGALRKAHVLRAKKADRLGRLLHRGGH